LDRLENADEKWASTLDYRETLRYLLDVYREHGEAERIAVAPSGSKMQTVALGVFRSFIKDVQIVYPTPAVYARPDDVTRGVRAVHRLALDGLSPLAREIHGNGGSRQDAL
jgi:hypothetical protein